MIPQTVLNVLEQYKRRSPDVIYVLAVSGGLDSLALLHICAKLGETSSIQYHVATLDHGLRGQAGADDAAFVVQTAQQLGLPVTQHTADVPGYAAEHHLSIELAARMLRYDFLASVVQKVGQGAVVTAHHADDQAESILLHIMRGSGLRGLRGMQTISQVPGHTGITLLRPLLSVSRAELEAYCRQHQLVPRQDTTNADTTYTRNAVRHLIMPQLRVLNPQVAQALSQLAESATVDEAYLQAQFERDIQPHCQRTGDRIAIALSSFTTWHPAMQRRAILFAVGQLAPDSDLSHERILAAVDVANRGQVGQVSEFSQGWRMRVGYASLFFEHGDMALPLGDYVQMAHDVIEVVVNGRTPIAPGIGLHTSTEPHPTGFAVALPEGMELILRVRRPGDVVQPPGLFGKHRKLKKWLIDRKVPQHVRDRLPLLALSGSIKERIVAALLPDGWYYLAMQADTEIHHKTVWIWLEKEL
ncbi:tRNA lysidine(34) synthetase TilS [Phototrophicus methaneseepsis]|uniref:tRNA(Ile)-lysidine synthase n=1 Tax=Phototrophicus methaneseepsis TaxID=2710758 RepID=A0A7S8E782_9CHLR|nr:tRNA lysidine(34) synthetase TilS [Phototrophicus methaneseepsis]QPC81620.1 tRNA lysidine(34) synthetase TilS [Phototrophicus methaneseepsis]